MAHHGNADAQIEHRYWPAAQEPPRLADGTVDVRELCRRWDDEVNGTSEARVATTPRTELAAIWDELEHLGSTVDRVDLDVLPDVAVVGRREHEARRLRVLHEGLAAGWTP